MTNSESHFIEEVYSFSIALRGSGRKRKIPFLLDEGTPITFNGHQSLGEYASYLNQLLSQIREELCQTRSPHSQVLALIMADLAVLLESRRLLPLNEKHFDKSWSTERGCDPDLPFAPQGQKAGPSPFDIMSSSFKNKVMHQHGERACKTQQLLANQTIKPADTSETRIQPV